MLNGPDISSYLLWEVDKAQLDAEKHAQFIIGRVVMKGTLNDWFEIKRYYGLERIKAEMLDIRYLDKLTLSFLSVYFNIPKEKFRCFQWRQSIPETWEY